MHSSTLEQLERERERVRRLTKHAIVCGSRRWTKRASRTDRPHFHCVDLKRISFLLFQDNNSHSTRSIRLSFLVESMANKYASVIRSSVTHLLSARCACHCWSFCVGPTDKTDTRNLCSTTSHSKFHSSSCYFFFVLFFLHASHRIRQERKDARGNSIFLPHPLSHSNRIDHSRFVTIFLYSSTFSYPQIFIFSAKADSLKRRHHSRIRECCNI